MDFYFKVRSTRIVVSSNRRQRGVSTSRCLLFMPTEKLLYLDVAEAVEAIACRSQVPANAARPPTKPPITAVTSTSNQPWPLSGSSCATRWASRPSLRRLNQLAITSQPNPTPKKPAINDRPPDTPRHAASTKHKGVITHQGRKSCTTKASTRISRKSSIWLFES